MNASSVIYQVWVTESIGSLLHVENVENVAMLNKTNAKRFTFIFASFYIFYIHRTLYFSYLNQYFNFIFFFSQISAAKVREEKDIKTIQNYICDSYGLYKSIHYT
jgi:hypothetical protein